MLELSEAIRDYHDHTGLPQVVSLDSLCAVHDIVYWFFIRYINHVGACACVHKQRPVVCACACVHRQRPVICVLNTHACALTNIVKSTSRHRLYFSCILILMHLQKENSAHDFCTCLQISVD